MNHNTFVTVMIIEYFAALIGMGLLFSDMGAIIYPISTVLFAVVLAPFYLGLKKTTDEARKRKLRRVMALLLLIPTIIAAIAAAMVIISLMLLFS